MTRGANPWALLVIGVFFIGCSCSRFFASFGCEAAVFFPDFGAECCWVGLSQAGEPSKIYRFVAADEKGCVTIMTDGLAPSLPGAEVLRGASPCCNHAVAAHEKDGITSGYAHFLPAGQRMALGIPLHPDRMSAADWQALPRVGPHLAEVIAEDRHKNGDFGELAALARVRGIGPVTIATWRQFFVDDTTN